MVALLKNKYTKVNRFEEGIEHRHYLQHTINSYHLFTYFLLIFMTTKGKLIIVWVAVVALGTVILSSGGIGGNLMSAALRQRIAPPTTVQMTISVPTSESSSTTQESSTSESSSTTENTCPPVVGPIDPQHPDGWSCGQEKVAMISIKPTPDIVIFDSICKPRPSEPYKYEGDWKSFWLNYWKNKSAWYTSSGANNDSTNPTWEVDPDKINEWNKQNKIYEDAVKNLSIACGKQLILNRDSQDDKSWIGLCKGCPAGSHGCINPLGEGNVEPVDDPSLGPKQNVVQLEEWYRDSWSICYRAICKFSKSYIYRDVKWSCSNCKSTN